MLSWLKDKIKGVKGQQNCIFCKIRDNPQNEQLNKDKKFLYQDDTFYVIHDIKKASAKQHILILTKKHYRTALDIKDKTSYKRMKQIGIKVLDRLQKQNWKNKQIQKKNEQNKEKYRFGFHLPPYNSIDHVHLHGFLLPITQWHFNKMFYGWAMTPVDKFIQEAELQK